MTPVTPVTTVTPVTPPLYFASTGNRGPSANFSANNDRVAGIKYPWILALQDWVGKSRNQLVTQMGAPTSSTSFTDGSRSYYYDQRGANPATGPLAMSTRLEFDINSDGRILTATSVAL